MTMYTKNRTIRKTTNQIIHFLSVNFDSETKNKTATVMTGQIRSFSVSLSKLTERKYIIWFVVFLIVLFFFVYIIISFHLYVIISLKKSFSMTKHYLIVNN